MNNSHIVQATIVDGPDKLTVTSEQISAYSHNNQHINVFVQLSNKPQGSHNIVQLVIVKMSRKTKSEYDLEIEGFLNRPIMIGELKYRKYSAYYNTNTRKGVISFS